MLCPAGADIVRKLEELDETPLEIKKMISSSSEQTRQASSMSADELYALLVSLRCVVLEDNDEGKADLEDETEFAWHDNKYEPQQQEVYSQVLKETVKALN